MIKLINRVIKVLITSNVFLNLGWGLLMPIFAIFIVQNITLENIAEAAKIVGFAELIFWTVKSVVQIPIGRYLDKNHGEKDDFWFMIVGTSIQTLVPIGLIFSQYAWHIYLLQVLHAVAAAMIFPSWVAIFTRHIDKGREAVEWSTQSTFAGIVVGIAGGTGGIVAANFGFTYILIFVSLFTFLSGILLFFIKKEISPINEKVIRVPMEESL